MLSGTFSQVRLACGEDGDSTSYSKIHTVTNDSRREHDS